MKAGDKVRIKAGVLLRGTAIEGVVEGTTDRYELRPYVALVAYGDRGIGMFTDDELEVIE